MRAGPSHSGVKLHRFVAHDVLLSPGSVTEASIEFTPPALKFQFQVNKSSAHPNTNQLQKQRIPTLDSSITFAAITSQPFYTETHQISIPSPPSCLPIPFT
jgi:hypothetical protein